MAGSIDWTKYGTTGGGGGGAVDWNQHGTAPLIKSGGGGSSGGGGLFGIDLGHYWDEATGAVSHGLTHGLVGGSSAPLLSHVYHQGTGFLAHVPDLIHIPGMIRHDITSPNNVSLIDLLQNPSGGWKKINRQLHDPHGFVGANYIPVAQDVNQARRGNWHYFEQHPLNPILDVATVASLGGGGALKLAQGGRLGARLESVANAERVLAHTNESGETLRIPLSQARTLQGRIRQQWFDRQSVANPDARVFGLHARTTRILNTRIAAQMLRARVPVRQFQRLTQALTPAERFAFHVAAEDVPLNDRILFYRAEEAIRPTRVLRGYLKQLESSDVRDALTNPRPEFIDALHKGHALSEEATRRLVQTGLVDQGHHEERVALPREMMGLEAPAATNSIHPDFPPAFRFWHTGGSGKSLEGSFTNPGVETMLNQKVLGQTKRSEGVLLRKGAFLTDPERVLATDSLSTFKHQMILSTQEQALRPISRELSMAHVDTAFKPSSGWFYRDQGGTIPRSVRETENLTRDRAVLDTQVSQRAEQVAAEGIVSKKLSDLGVNEKELAGLKTDEAKLEYLKNHDIRWVPNAYGKDFIKTFQGTPAWLRYLVDRPLDVWRAITLNFRPAWWINNVVGNALMGIAAHPSSAAWYLRVLLSTEKGEAKVRKIMGWTFSHPTLRRKYAGVFDEVAPELHSAGQFGTQTRITHGGAQQGAYGAISNNAAVKLLGKVGDKTVMKVGRGITRAEVLFAEDTGREAVFIAAAKGDIGKIRATARAMGEGNISLAEALRRMDSDSIERAINAVNDALGNFNDLSHFERAVLRRFIPFYSWYKVITKVSAKYAARYPARLKLLANIQQAQDRSGEPALPSWLVGSQMVGKERDGYQQMISTQGLNPYATIPQTLEGGFGGLLNPYGAAAVTGLTGANPTFGPGQDYFGFGATNRKGFAGGLERGAGSFIGNLPLSRLIAGESTRYQGKLYNPSTYHRNLLLQYLGLPLRDVNVQEAKRERGL